MADADQPGVLQLDPYQSVVNINWAGGDFFMGGALIAGPHIEKSFDGKEWENNPAPVGSITIIDAAYGGGTWIVVAGAETLKLYRSQDSGATWEFINGPTTTEFPSSARIVAGKPMENGDEETGEIKLLFLLTTISQNTDEFWWSDDFGETWHAATLSGSPSSNRVSFIDFAEGAFFVGTRAHSLEENDSFQAYILRSKNGKTWSGTPAFANTIPPVSPPRTRPQDQNISGMALLSTLDAETQEPIKIYVVIGDSKLESVPGDSASTRPNLVISKSSDGISWSGDQQFGALVSSQARITATKEKFVIVASVHADNFGENTTTADMLTSTDGVSWTRSNPGGVGWQAGNINGTTQPLQLAYGKKQKRLVTVLFSSDFITAAKPYIYSSEDGSAWEAGTNAFTTASIAPNCLRIGKMFKEQTTA
jgi:hypothetical protein